MAKQKYLFTSESVTEGHPDKLADQISDSVLDAYLAQDPLARVACETSVTTGLVLLFGEISGKAQVNAARVARDTIAQVGYTSAEYGLDAEHSAVLVSIDQQSPDIAQGSIRRWSCAGAKGMTVISIRWGRGPGDGFRLRHR